LPPLVGAHLLAAVGIRLPRRAGIVIGLGMLVASAFGFTRMILTPIYGIVAPLILGLELGG
jgi:hypothetical protein